jgi:hypothetical protein
MAMDQPGGDELISPAFNGKQNKWRQSCLLGHASDVGHKIEMKIKR